MGNGHAPPRTALLIDPEPRIRQLLRFALEAHGYRIMEAGTANEARGWIALERPTLVLLELRLPDGDALDICRTLRRDTRTSNAVVLAMTTLGGDEQQRWALQAGADAVVLKPFRPGHLLALVGQLLAEREGPGGANWLRLTW